jgi:glycosyltransferase involved in cell wall biosynthesis
MKILYVVHRYGPDIVGGAETACRMFAEQLVLRGHSVDVLTSCAQSYVTWENVFTPGTSEENGVVVHRLPVTAPRNPAAFSELHEQILNDPLHATLAEQLEWLDAMGPLLDGQDAWLQAHAHNYDVAIFMTYLYPTTAYGVPVVHDYLPVVLQPTAHDEPPIHLPYYKSLFEMADAFVFLTPEEREVVRGVLDDEPDGVISGIGMPIDEKLVAPDDFRSRHSLGKDPYLLYVGRIDTMKGVGELFRFFVEYKGQNPSSLKLVLAGDASMEIPDYEGFVHVGFLSELEKREAIAGAVALVQPSPFESFSIVVCEAWLQKRPVLVQGYSPVLSGQVMRSEGGLPYTGFAEFEGCLSLLLNNPALADELGENGSVYVRKTYNWDHVLDVVEKGIDIARDNFRNR